MINTKSQLRLIIDTNIFISAFCFDKKSDELIQLVEKSSHIILLLSDKLRNEIHDKFLNGRVEKILKEKHDKMYTEMFLLGLDQKSTLINPPKTTKINLCRDPKDNMLLELAYFSQADYIVTGDKDLLVLDKTEFQDYTFTIVDINKFLELVED